VAAGGGGRIAHHTCKAGRQGEEHEIAVRQRGVGAALALLQGPAGTSAWARVSKDGWCAHHDMVQEIGESGIMRETGICQHCCTIAAGRSR
jgi:hypothetical protein